MTVIVDEHLFDNWWRRLRKWWWCFWDSSWTSFNEMESWAERI